MCGQNDGGPAIARSRSWKLFFTEIPVALGGNQTSTIYDAIQEIDFEVKASLRKLRFGRNGIVSFAK